MSGSLYNVSDTGWCERLVHETLLMIQADFEDLVHFTMSVIQAHVYA